MTVKHFLYAIATLSVVACSENDDVLSSGNTANSLYGPNGEPKIALGISTASDVVSVSSKGTGTVGDTEESGKNSWNGEIIRVYMFNKGTLTPSSVSIWNAVGTELYEDTEANTFYNTEVVTPKPTDDTPVATGVAQRKDNKVCYYPLRGSSDFWGYYVDDADVVLDEEGNKVVDEEGNFVRNAPVVEGEQMYVPFQINGTQDILTGQTLEKDDPGNTEFYTSKGVEASELYSAKAARHDVQPTLKFRHKLARLTFTARAMQPEDGANNTVQIPVREVTASDAAHKLAVADAGGDESGYVNGGVYFDSIFVYSKNKGKLYFAYTDKADLHNGRNNQRIEWDVDSKGDALKGWLKLFAKPDKDAASQSTVKMAGVQPNDVEPTRLGDAILVAPQDDYEFRVVMHQYVKQFSDEYYKLHPNVLVRYKARKIVYPAFDNAPYAIPLAAELAKKGVESVVGGMTYNIELGVAGLKMVVVDATLEPWVEGGDIEKNLE
ncbi:MAG: hypothetical protein J6P01_05560 [Prevotella sp.]|nr:hypothetical protein [Prevotella sp.]